MMGRQFVMGDIHGAHKAMLQCFEKARFDYANDTLIFLGDVVDGWPDAPACIDELLKISHLIMLMGNHDKWAFDWAISGKAHLEWNYQGGKETIDCFNGKMKTRYIDFFRKAKLYHIQDNRLFVHAGFDLTIPFVLNNEMNFLWDRSLAKAAIESYQNNENTRFASFRDVYIGHTPLTRYGYTTPVNASNIWLMDTGAGWTGSLSMMEINTKEVYQSCAVPVLYKGIRSSRMR